MSGLRLTPALQKILRNPVHTKSYYVLVRFSIVPACRTMPKKAEALSVQLHPPSRNSGARSGLSSPRSPRSPQDSPTSSLGMVNQAQRSADASGTHSENFVPYPPPPGTEFDSSPSDQSTFASLPPLPQSPRSSESNSESARPFFANYKASKSSSRLHPEETTIRQVSDGDVISSSASPSASSSQKSTVYGLRKSPGSYPDLPAANNQSASISTSRQEQGSGLDRGQMPKRPLGGPSKSDSMVQPDLKFPPASRKHKPRPFAHLLGRARSTRMDPPELVPKNHASSRLAESETAPSEIDTPTSVSGLRTAPLQHERDRSFRDMMSSTIRNRSADRQLLSHDSEDGSSTSKETGRHHLAFSTTHREGTSSNILSNLKSSSTKAADGLGKAGKGIFGKLTRSGSSGEREVPTDENYVCSVITLPLVEQTRMTRISKRLEHSKDKTEFWMPALPWRCIDYLNFKGCEEEGLYRIPGSGYKVKQWQKRFDTEYDIDLFDEPDLFDINIIGSMFKAWLRELPDEILPKSTQARIAEKCMGATEVPQMLKDELSMLPPFNYYLLFAITCHLSLLHSYVDQNKMDYRNLCICFQPCLKMDGFCFQFLVCDWKNCWQGCWTEKEALTEEYRILDGLGRDSEEIAVEERAISSSSSSKPPRSPDKEDRLRPAQQKPVDEKSDELSMSDTGTDSSPSSESRRLPELKPLMPLSPLGL
ncbi:MAG: hypothetical protein M1825_004760 [Sarcosagium campestre]|nr:MAG: hypothetical protein M1825_004760 [Sarcosagium campestre]